MSVDREPRAPIAPHAPPSTTHGIANIDRLIVGSAGDDVSLGAIRVGVALARQHGAAVTAIGVTPPLPPDVYAALAPSPSVTNEAGRLELLAALRETLSQVPGTELWDKRAVIGTPATSIDDLAGADSRTLILIGLGHHGRLDRLFGGETTIPVIKQARVPVLAVAADAAALPRFAVAAVDFSEASLSAAELAAEILDEDGILTLAHVCAFGDATSQPGDLIDLYRAGVRARLDQAVERLRGRTKRRVESVVLPGQVAEALISYAKAAKSDLIALGGDELGLIDRILLGSVRTKVVRATTCSVLIAPPASSALASA